LLIDIEITNKQYDSRPGLHEVFTNQNGDRAINLKIKIKNNYKLPMNIGFYFIGVPKFPVDLFR
jgi:hypothetical protein